ncbi:chromatin assembly factor 1 subunit A-like [Patiria miniata]|uniref:Uncharacterized protein n=1 Tax=Patiria miniata TaxID=46514 RepID=A0A914AT56_PATMI|nr:chromatin assembly factor 1 subunit A-like [Patiria miniata]
MIGEYAPDSGVGSKKRSLTSPGNVATSEGPIMSPPTKKLKQARLPFKVISSPSPNQCDKPSVTASPLPSKKRKLSGTDRSQTPNHPTKVKSTDAKLSAKKPADNPAKKFFVKKVLSSPVPPKNPRIETIDLDPEVSSSCEDQESNKPTSSSATPKRSLASKPKSLDSFLQTTQQPQVSTSDDVFDLSDDDILVIIEEELSSKENHDGLSATETMVADVESSRQSSQAATPSQKSSRSTASETEKTSDDKESKLKKEAPLSEMDVSMTCLDDSATASKLSYDADSEDGNDDEEARTVKSSEGSSEAESSTGGSTTNAGPATPKGVGKPVKKTPLSAKALKKLEEKEQLREEKIKSRMEKKRKLQEEEAERKRQKMNLKKEKEQERDEARKQKEMEKDVKRKERQQKKEEDEKEKEQRRMAKEEERKKKQENMDAKMEEKRKKNEERQRQEEEKQKQEDEKREKEARQKNFFKSFFKEAVVPVKKPQEKSCGWFAPFQVKDDMVLAPVRRCQKLPEVLEEFDTAFENQNLSSLYLDGLKSKTYVVGKAGRTPQGESEAQESSSRIGTPSVEKMQPDGDSQDVQLVSETPAKPAKKLVRMKCKLLQFHENYRPAYYGTWRRKSPMINPRNYLKKDEDLLDYEVDSDDEWEEPGESLSHSEGEDDGEEVDDGGDSDDGFFVPHGYLSESEGCEDEEEAENWKERRAAKAKSWEVELKRQQGVLKAVLIGCIWATGAQQSTSKMLDAYKAVALTTVPIDTRSKKQVAAANVTHSAEESSKTSVHPKGPWSDIGASLKRPVPAEAMPDLIRLVHGNTAGIKTLQREFREYWRLKDLSKKSGQTTPRPETPTTAEASQSVQTSSEEPRIVGTESPLPGPTGGEVKTPVLNELNPGMKSPSVQTQGREATPVSDGGTPEVTHAGQSSPANPTGDSIECSISKRQLMITINDIAVREKRPQFPRTCWYVHQRVLEKYNQQNLPIPCQWQNITKPQKTLRAESPLVGHSLPAYGTQTPVPTQGGYTAVMIQQNPMLVGSGHQPAIYVSNSSMHLPQPSGTNQGNTIPPRTTASGLNPLAVLNPHASVLQPSSVALPFQLQVANGMSASEIMQRLSATVPIQQNQSPPTLSANPAHVFNPITPGQMHYLNMLPKPTVVPSPQTVRITASQINKAATSYAVKVPRTSPNDIKAMLSSQAAKPTASPTNVKSDSKSSTAVSEAAPALSPGHTQEVSAVPPAQKPGVKTLKSFFNVKPVPKSQLDQTETSNSFSESKMKKGPEEMKDASESNDAVHPVVADDKEKTQSCIDVGKEMVQKKVEEMEVIEIN